MECVSFIVCCQVDLHQSVVPQSSHNETIVPRPMFVVTLDFEDLRHPQSMQLVIAVTVLISWPQVSPRQAMCAAVMLFTPDTTGSYRYLCLPAVSACF